MVQSNKHYGLNFIYFLSVHSHTMSFCFFSPHPLSLSLSLSRSLSPPLSEPGLGAFSGRGSMKLCPRGRRSPAPTCKYPASANHTTARTSVRPRTTTAGPGTTTASWSTVRIRGYLDNSSTICFRFGVIIF